MELHVHIANFKEQLLGMMALLEKNDLVAEKREEIEERFKDGLRESIGGITNLILVVSNTNGLFYVYSGNRRLLRRLLRWGIPRELQLEGNKLRCARAILNPVFIEDMEEFHLDAALECCNSEEEAKEIIAGHELRNKFDSISSELLKGEYFCETKEGIDLVVKQVRFYDRKLDFELKSISSFVCFLTIGRKYYYFDGGWGTERNQMCFEAVEKMFGQRTKDELAYLLYGKFYNAVMGITNTMRRGNHKEGIMVSERLVDEYTKRKFGPPQIKDN